MSAAGSGEEEAWPLQPAPARERSHLRFLTCGSVDDGKSTLIGRLLYDAKLLFEDHERALARDSRRYGATGDDLDFALLLEAMRRTPQSERFAIVQSPLGGQAAGRPAAFLRRPNVEENGVNRRAANGVADDVIKHAARLFGFVDNNEHPLQSDVQIGLG